MPTKSSQLYLSWILLLYSIFLLDQTTAIFQYCNWNIYTQREVNSATDYTFDVRPSDSLRTFAAIKFQWSAASGIVPASTVTCRSNIAGSFASSTPTCTAGVDGSGNNYVIVQGAVSGYAMHQIELSTVTNAPTTKPVADATCITCSDNTCSATPVETLTATALTFDSATIASTNIVIASNKNYNGEEDATATIKFRTTNPIVATGAIKLVLPKANNAYSSLLRQYRKPLITSTISPTYTVYHAAIGSTAYTSVTLTAQQYLSSNPDLDHDTLILTLGNSVAIGANQEVYVGLYPTRNPPSLEPLTGFIITTGEYPLSTWYSTDIGSGGTLTTSIAGLMYNTGSLLSGVAVTSGSTMVSTSGVTYRFSIYQTNDVPSASSIYIQFPTTWTLDCTGSWTITSIGSTSSCSSTNIVCMSVEQRIQLLNCFTSIYSAAPGPIEFDLGGFTNPATTDTQYLGVTTYQYIPGGLYGIDSSSAWFGISATTGALTITSITPSSYEIYDSSGIYTFLVTAEHDIETTYQIKITLPSPYGVVQNAACTTTGLATTTTCAADATNKIITITTFTTAQIAALTQFEFTVDSIQNPGIFTSPGSIAVEVTTATGGAIDQGLLLIPDNTYVHSNITTFTVTSNDAQAGKQGVTYSFTVIPSHRVAQGSYLMLYLPTEVTISDTSLMSRSCASTTVSGFSQEYILCSYDSNRGGIRVRDGFKYSDTQGDPPTLQFNIPYLANPRSQMTSGTFNVTIYDSLDQALYYFNTTDGPTVTMTSFGEPIAITYDRTSNENGVLNNYSWRIQPLSYLIPGDQFQFTMPEPVRFTDATKCYGTSFWINEELDCTFSIDMLTATMTVKITAKSRRLEESEAENAVEKFLEPYRGRSLQFTQIEPSSLIDLLLTNVYSSVSLKPTEGSIQYKVITAENFVIEGKTEGFIVTNTVPGNLSNLTTEIVPYFFEKDSFTVYKLSFVPKNFQINMQIKVYVPPQLEMIGGLPNCTGVAGCSQSELSVAYDRVVGSPTERVLTFLDSQVTTDLMPAVISINISTMKNPAENIVTDSFRIWTETKDGYIVDARYDQLEINFYCIFPCKTCNLTEPTQCYSCYYSNTIYKYLHLNKCWDDCPAGFYEYQSSNTSQPICQACKSPCATCDKSGVDCVTCIEGYLLYDYDNTCYKAINWIFPFLICAFISFLTVLIVDQFKPSTNFLHSILFALSVLEVGCWITLIILAATGEVQGERGLAISSFIVQILLNIVFIPVHVKLMIPHSSSEYKQILDQYQTSSQAINISAYIFNFKMVVMLVSSFAARPYFSGNFSPDNWQKFNIFAIAYILLVYFPFIIDFYSYFTAYGLRQLTSFVAMETTIIMTIIVIILVLEILQQCSLAGFNGQDLGKRAGLINDMKKKGKKDKRRAFRSGRANMEDSYESEYDDEYDYYEERKSDHGSVIESIEEEEEEEEYEEEEESEEEQETIKPISLKKQVTKKESTKISTQPSQPSIKPTSRGGQSIKSDGTVSQQDNAHLEMLEKLAQQMKDEKDNLDSEKQKMLDEKLKLVEEKEKYFTDAAELKDNMDKEHEKMRKQITMRDGQGSEIDPDKIMGIVDERIDQKFAENKPKLILPNPIFDYITVEKEMDGDDEYWLQNATPRKSYVSGRSGIKEMDASEIEYVSKVDGKSASFLDATHRSIGSIEEEMRADQSQGPVFGKDVTEDADRSLHGTEKAFLNKSQDDANVYGDDDGSRNKSATVREGRERASAIYSNIDDGKISRDISGGDISQALKAGGRDLEGTEIDAMEERKSAAFGDLSSLQKAGSQEDFIGNSQAAFGGVTPITDKHGQSFTGEPTGKEPEMDLAGRSDESSEGIVVDHAPFKGIQEAMANQDKLRGSQKPPTDEESAEDSIAADEVDGKGAEAAKRRRIKQVLYSDKSESSVDDMMEDTPSNYNIANGRLEGKSMGLKAILLFAKNQGIQLGAGQPGPPEMKGNHQSQLPQINEENPANVGTPNGPARGGPLDRHSLLQSSGEAGQWKAFNQPMNAITGRNNPTQIVAAEELGNQIGGTLDPDESRSGVRKQSTRSRHPGLSKQFKEPAEGREDADSGEVSSKIKKNNFI